MNTKTLRAGKNKNFRDTLGRNYVASIFLLARQESRVSLSIFGGSMSKEYVVRPGLGNYLVLRETKDVNGDVVNVEICDTFSRMDEAQVKARLGNYIMLKSREACRKLQVQHD